MSLRHCGVVKCMRGHKVFSTYELKDYRVKEQDIGAEIMIRWSTLNEANTVVSFVSEREFWEVEIERSMEIYQRALRLHQKGRIKDAKDLYENLLKSKIFQRPAQIDSLEKDAIDQENQIASLQYTVLKNYADILEDEEKQGQLGHGAALIYYIKATGVDSSDHSLWYRIGTLAAKEKRFRLARLAFENAIGSLDGDITALDLGPIKWWCLEELCNVLYQLGDYTSCLRYIEKAMKIYPDFERGKWLQHQILDGVSGIDAAGDLSESPENSVKPMEGETFLIEMPEPSWECLCESLLNAYSKICPTSQDDDESNQENRGEDMKKPFFLGRKLIINVQEPSPSVPPPANTDQKSQEVEVVDLSKEDNEVEANSNIADSTGILAEDDSRREKSPPINKRRRSMDLNEERRATRVSKRVREKLDQSEVSKRKLEQEETMVFSKIDDFLKPYGWSLKGRLFDDGQAQDPFNDWTELQIQDFLSNFTRRVEDIPYQTSVSPPISDQRRGSKDKGKIPPNSGKEKDNVNKKKSVELKLNFALFTPNPIRETEPGRAEDSDQLLRFVDELNHDNSGILDCLCRLLQRIFGEQDTNQSWFRHWSKRMKQAVANIYDIVEEHLLYFYSQANKDEMNNRNLDQDGNNHTFLISIAEFVLDRLITHIMTDTNKSALGKSTAKETSAKDCKSSGASENNSRAFTVLHFWDLIIKQTAMDALSGNSDAKKSQLIARYCWFHGKLEQCRGNAGSAIHFFNKLLDILPHDDRKIILENCAWDSVISRRSATDKLSVLQTQHHALEASRLLDLGEYEEVVARLEPILFSKNTEPSVKDNSDMEQDDAAASNISLLNGPVWNRVALAEILSEAYSALGKTRNVFQCTCCYAIDIFKVFCEESGVASYEEFWSLIEMVNNTLTKLIPLLNKNGTKDSGEDKPVDDYMLDLSDTLRESLVEALIVMARTALANMFHQSAFRLDIDNSSGNPLSSKSDNIRALNLLTVQTWTTLILVFQRKYQSQIASLTSTTATPAADPVINEQPQSCEPMDIDASEEEQKVQADSPSEQENEDAGSDHEGNSHSVTPKRYNSAIEQLTYGFGDFLALIHDEVGWREICSIDKRIFLNILLEIFSTLDKVYYRKEIYQCYYCLYGVRLGADSVYPIEHESTPQKFDKSAAARVFNSVSSSLSDKALRPGQLKADIKDVLSDIAEQFSDPPYDIGLVALNRSAIERYLVSSVRFFEEVDFTSGCVPLTTASEEAFRKKISSDVYFKIYYIQGKIFQGMAKSRAKTNAYQATEDFETAIDYFTKHLIMCPESYTGWHALAQSFIGVADETLTWSALEIQSNMNRVLELQKKAFHCYSRAISLMLRNPSIKPLKDRDTRTEIVSLWSDFGYHIFAMSTAPMAMIGFRSSLKRPSLASDGTAEFIKDDNSEPMTTQVFKFAKYCFGRAMSLDPNDWRLPYMIGKCSEKLEKKPENALRFYFIAANLAENAYINANRERDKEKDRVLEPVYKVVSLLAKSLFRKSISVDEVLKAINHEIFNSFQTRHVTGYSNDQETMTQSQQVLMEHSSTGESERFTSVVGVSAEELSAYNAILNRLLQIRAADKKKWHHRPVYRHAWMLHKVYNDPDKAKLELQQLFQLKTPTKTLIQVWTPDFENSKRSGRHFVYVQSYTDFMIRLARETNDTETLKMLCRRLRKASSILLEHREIWSKLYNAFLDVYRDQINSLPPLVLVGTLSKTEFEQNRASVEQRFFAAEPRPVALGMMQDIYEIKKLNNHYCPSEGDIDQLLVMCYSTLYRQYSTTVSETSNTGGENGRVFDMKISSLLVDDSAKDSSDNATTVPPPTDTKDSKPPPRLSFKDIFSRTMVVCRSPPCTKSNDNASERQPSSTTETSIPASTTSDNPQEQSTAVKAL
ncbi:uncharacterized protein VTP21DRAFT_555 [Calcarisporiella thermophila]|uniref:uncharacterized protein n=1 Tax=Calcarisporiella thermophila TaxID=911321 RepID=UPI003743425A